MVSSLLIHNPPLVRSIHHHHCFSPDLENSQEIQASVRNLRSFTLSPGPVLLSSQDQSDKPESDQYFNFPLICVQPPEDDEVSGLLRPIGCQEAPEALSRSSSPSATGLSGLSHTSLESDAFYRLVINHFIPFCECMYSVSKSKRTQECGCCELVLGLLRFYVTPRLSTNYF